ncbi:hypothetical protein ACGFNX_04295 [Streptomyces sp. NPDC048723]|uniref:preATP grasp domain-containing protein n=1 Tax=Streptomyces sp. NPDC048723 TaxID=3365589 RepID=UPI0037146BFE
MLVTPVLLSREFLRYVYGLTGVPPESVALRYPPPRSPRRSVSTSPISAATTRLLNMRAHQSPGPSTARRWAR